MVSPLHRRALTTSVCRQPCLLADGFSHCRFPPARIVSLSQWRVPSESARSEPCLPSFPHLVVRDALCVGRQLWLGKSRLGAELSTSVNFYPDKNFTYYSVCVAPGGATGSHGTTCSRLGWTYELHRSTWTHVQAFMQSRQLHAVGFHVATSLALCQCCHVPHCVDVLLQVTAFPLLNPGPTPTTSPWLGSHVVNPGLHFATPTGLPWLGSSEVPLLNPGLTSHFVLPCLGAFRVDSGGCFPFVYPGLSSQPPLQRSSHLPAIAECL